MSNKYSLIAFFCITGVVLYSCNNLDNTAPANTTPGDSVPDSGWNIPINEIISGGVPKDGIPSLFNPLTIPADQANYLSDEDLVVGIVVNGQPRAYPHTILDWHEVVNEDFPTDNPITISYCPLTGTAIAFDGNNSGLKLKFGVSGLLFNNNLIMFDRETDSHWPQMRLQCDQGELRNTKQIVYPSKETSWGSWKKLYPNTVILSTNTGFRRPYDRPGSAYPGYNLPDSPPLFSISFSDNRLPMKQRIHGVILGEGPNNYQTKVYIIDSTQNIRLINDTIASTPVLVIDDGKDNFVVSYFRNVNATTLTFKLVEEINTLPFTFQDNETGSTWNVLGEAVDGPLVGTKLEKTLSYNAYWFAWGVFFRGADIYEELN
ncbi:MAG: DUF3179 domain-containing protein [bacterium]